MAQERMRGWRRAGLFVSAALGLTSCAPNLESLEYVRVTLDSQSLVVEELGPPDASGKRKVERLQLSSLEGTMDGTSLQVTSLGRTIQGATNCNIIFPGICGTGDVYMPPTLAFQAPLLNDAPPHTIKIKAGSKTWVIDTPDFRFRPSLTLTAPGGTVLHQGDRLTVDCGSGGTLTEVYLVFPWKGERGVTLAKGTGAPGPISFDLDLQPAKLTAWSGQALAGQLGCTAETSFGQCDGPAECSHMPRSSSAINEITVQVP